MPVLRARNALVLFCFTARALAQSQPPIPGEIRSWSSAALDSPANSLRSLATQIQLGIWSGRRSVRPSGHTGSGESRPGRLTPSEVLVNNPVDDTFAEDDFTVQNTPSIASFNDTLLATYFDTGALFLTSSVIGLSRSTDRGATFQDIGTFTLPFPFSLASLGPGEISSSRSGAFYLVYDSIDITQPFDRFEAIAVSRSNDAGQTWLTPVRVPVSAAGPNGLSQTEPTIAADNTNGPRRGSIYVAWVNTNFGPSGLDVRVLVSRSTDGGASFSLPAALQVPGRRNTGPRVAIGPDGTVYVAWLDTTALPRRAAWVARSTDGAATFTAPVRIAEFEESIFATGRRLASIATPPSIRMEVNPINGDVCAVYYAKGTREDDPSDVFFVRSRDRGQTWSAPLRVNDDNTESDQFFPDLAVAADGDIEVIWYDRRRDRDNFQVEVFHARSRDGGAHFGPDRRLTSDQAYPQAFFDSLAGPGNAGSSIDIQTRITAAGAATDFLSVWTDFRRGMVNRKGLRTDQDIVFSAIR